MPRLDLIRGLRRHPGMFGVAPDDYSALVAYLCGYDAATNGGFLSGFRELIELKLGRTTNVAWWDVVTQLRRPGEDNAHVSDAERIAYLLDVLEEFVIVDSGHLRRLYADWAAMATSEASSVTGDLLHFGQSPAPAQLSLDDAAQRLGLPPAEVISLIGEKRLRGTRVGSEIRVTADSVNEYLRR